jgi:hypothetical protein
VQFSLTNPVSGTTTSASRTSSAVDDNLYVAPRLWLGLQGPCWGIVGRYWQLNASEMYFDSFSDTAGYIGQDRLDAYALDLEITRRLCCGCTVWNLGLGARNAGYNHDSTLVIERLLGGQPTDPFLTGIALASSQFNGTGPTLGLGGYRPVHSGCNYCLNLFWNLRGSVLWGDISNSAEGKIDFAGPFGSLSLAELSTAREEEELLIGEVQVGLRWDHQLQCARMRAFFQVAGEYQAWEANGPAATFNSAPVLSGIGTAWISASDARMDFYGLSIGTGCVW